MRSRAALIASHLNEQLGQLVGGKIVDVEVQADDDGEYWPVFKVKGPSGTFIVTVSRDTEGNGPGHLVIEPDL